MARIDQVSVAARRAYQLAASNGQWPVYAWGPTGTGKTCFAAVAYTMFPQSALWFSLTRLCEDLVRFNTNSTITIYSGETPVEVTKGQYWGRLERTGLLIVDEIGTRESSGHRFDVLLMLLETRKGRPLVLTGNIPPSQLVTVYDERVLSRVCEGSLIEFTGEDQRMKGVAERVYKA